MNISATCIKDPDVLGDIDRKTLIRFDTLLNLFQSFVDANIFTDKVYINEALLYRSVYSYYVDLQRTKCYHNIPLADPHKKAAFTMKWLTKVKPIQIKHTIEVDQIDEVTQQANEWFAFIAGMSFLDTSIDKIPDHYISNILYILQYRDIECLVLSSQMYLLERSFI